MENELKVLHVAADSGFYRVERVPIGRFFGPVDLGLFLTQRDGSLNFGTGLFCGSVFPGSNRLIFTGRSPCWENFYVSSMGGAGLVFDNLGVNMVSIHGRAPTPSLVYLNRMHGEEIEVALSPLDVDAVWKGGRTGAYAVTDEAYARFGERYKTDPRVLATGPASRATDMGGVVSVPIEDGRITKVDTWAGRGGLGSQLFQTHNVAGVIYGGTFIDEDFRDRNVANQWFEERFNKRMAAKDMDATVKYRMDEELKTGGTLGVNYAKMGDRLLAFNYRSIFLDKAGRLEIQDRLVKEHYLRQFNEDLFGAPKKETMRNCGEPCVAICKKMNGPYKKDYEPYQAMGPLTGIFDQRAAEALNHHADAAGFDGIAVGGVLAWLMDCLHDGLLKPDELGVSGAPVFKGEGFAVEADSHHNAKLGIELIDGILARRGPLDLHDGPRRRAWQLAREKGREVVDRFLYTASGVGGWMVPNQYWTPGVLSPMPIMGKYYNHYGNEYVPPRALGRMNVTLMQNELILDNGGFCRFHRSWAQEMVPDLVEKLFGCGAAFTAAAACLTRQLARGNQSVFWESKLTLDFVTTALERMQASGAKDNEDLSHWLGAFKKNPQEAALDYWYEIRKGVEEAVREAV
ncbi:MAG: aldehyde ferredoxin oxidoreductase N-terminal domain-containing protein [Polyangia bacterium]|jgi:glyceraldehyde-3-phosphate dehydrogenase (ferredoxin)|nr:aldehyde ferredoxin oxidoreductase N-terminal domain-containing protein [Polyangia bacterium]